MVKRLKQMWVDADLHRKLKKEAAAAGMSLKDYLAEKMNGDVYNMSKRFKRGIF